MKRVIIFVLILIFALNSNISTYASELSLNVVNNNIEILGSYPKVELKNNSFEHTVNNKINYTIENKIKTYSKSTRKNIHLSYKIIKDNDITSVVLYFKNLLTKEVDVSSINFNIKTNHFVSINSVLGANGLNFANKIISTRASNMGIKFIKVMMSTPFYVKNNNVYVIYGAGNITFPQKGNIIFEVLKDNINNFTIEKSNFYEKSGYNIRFVPLRSTLSYFGYNMSWNSENSSITVTKDGIFKSYLVVNKNRYTSKNNKIIRQLEFPPEVINDITYVPISYFSEILNMIFAIDEKNNVIISSYIMS